jgi:hypothetical protein
MEAAVPSETGVEAGVLLEAEPETAIATLPTDMVAITAIAVTAGTDETVELTDGIIEIAEMAVIAAETLIVILASLLGILAQTAPARTEIDHLLPELTLREALLWMWTQSLQHQQGRFPFHSKSSSRRRSRRSKLLRRCVDKSSEIPIVFLFAKSFATDFYLTTNRMHHTSYYLK